jgi:hypothetical protein
MGFKDVTKPANIGWMQQAIDGVGDENEGHHNPNDIEAAARIMYRTIQPVFVHTVSLRRCLPHSRSWAMILLSAPWLLFLRGLLFNHAARVPNRLLR